MLGNPPTSEEHEPILPEATARHGPRSLGARPYLLSATGSPEVPFSDTHTRWPSFRAAAAKHSLAPPFLPVLPLCLHHPFLPSKRGSGPGFTCTTLEAEAILLPIVTPERGSFRGAGERRSIGSGQRGAEPV